MLQLSRVKRCHAPFAALAALAALACLAAPQAATASEPEQSGREVRSYWTPERMANAVPGDALLSDVAAVLPVDDLDLGLGSPEARRAQARAVGNPRSRPFRAHGKVFFTLGLSDYVCSGTSVKSETKSLVVTAGHCTYSQANGYATNFMFVPAYDQGKEPFGKWTAKRLKATPQWEASEDLRYDVGMATMRKRPSGKKLAQRVGSRGIAFKKGRDVRFSAFGYPAEGDFNGERMFRCDSPAKGTDNGPRPRPTRIECDMTGGSSGGGWVLPSGDVNSVVSYGYECTIIILPCENPEQGNLFGPYFGKQIKKLYRSQK